MKYLPFAFILLLSSCSTQSLKDLFKGEKNSEKRNKELMESFGAKEEVFEKFSETKEEPVNGKAPDKPQKTEPAAPEKKAVKVAKKKVVVKTIPKKEAEPAPAKASKKELPEDYPEELKQINAKAVKLWKAYQPKFFKGETIFMDINYMGVSTGKIVLSTLDETIIGGIPVHHVHARVKTADYYRYLYELDDNIDSYVAKERALPVKFSLIQRESGQDVDDLQLFDLEELKTYSFYQRVAGKKVKKKKEEKHTPTHFTDPLYVIWFLRGLPMEKGASFEVPIMNRGKVILLKAENKGVETITTPIGKRRAYRMTATTTYTGETLKSGDMTFWFSADEKRVFLKFDAKIKIGSISGEIEKYEP